MIMLSSLCCLPFNFLFQRPSQLALRDPSKNPMSPVPVTARQRPCASGPVAFLAPASSSAFGSIFGLPTSGLMQMRAPISGSRASATHQSLRGATCRDRCSMHQRHRAGSGVSYQVRCPHSFDPQLSVQQSTGSSTCVSVTQLESPPPSAARPNFDSIFGLPASGATYPAPRAPYPRPDTSDAVPRASAALTVLTAHFYFYSIFVLPATGCVRPSTHAHPSPPLAPDFLFDFRASRERRYTCRVVSVSRTIPAAARTHTARADLTRSSLDFSCSRHRLLDVLIATALTRQQAQPRCTDVARPLRFDISPSRHRAASMPGIPNAPPLHRCAPNPESIFGVPATGPTRTLPRIFRLDFSRSRHWGDAPNVPISPAALTRQPRCADAAQTFLFDLSRSRDRAVSRHGIPDAPPPPPMFRFEFWSSRRGVDARGIPVRFLVFPSPM
ncbi:hypothetical protein B0H15DRAFT_998944 [Mycena belliarum]|uniref:Uncharacterized protein n=1 Tax=Mycena belliarum TaxID=1033014 RepID=A0AAD6XW10_9AGAR|nr:hypothetical protein B0H15DRAFT_998944 [Mycena belliae]